MQLWATISRYIHLLYDNNSGKKIGFSPADYYCYLFRSRRGALIRKMDQKRVKEDTASALWCLQISHQTQLSPQGPGYN